MPPEPDTAAPAGPHRFNLEWGLHTIMRLVEEYDSESVLDIGSGSGEHSRFFHRFGRAVFSINLTGNAEVPGVNWGERSYELPPAKFPGGIRITSKYAEPG